MIFGDMLPPTPAWLRDKVANGELEFPTTEAMSLIGLTTTTVRRQEIAEEVPAHGVIAYDRKLLSRLSSPCSKHHARTSADRPGESTE